MKTKQILIIIAIILVLIAIGIGAFQLLGFWKTFLMTISYIIGIGSGWYFKYLKDKYIK